jgi:hypothetical protein
MIEELRIRLLALRDKSIMFYAHEMQRYAENPSLENKRKLINYCLIPEKKKLLFDITKSLVEMDRKQIDTSLRLKAQLKQYDEQWEHAKAVASTKIIKSAWFQGDDTEQRTYY